MRRAPPPTAQTSPVRTRLLLLPCTLPGLLQPAMSKHNRKASEVPLFSEELASPSVVEGPNARPVSPDVASSRQRNKGPPPEP